MSIRTCSQDCLSVEGGLAQPRMCN